MTTRVAPRRFAGARVHAKAMHVTSIAECARRYGSQSRTKMVSGTVADVRIENTSKRANCFLTVNWELGGSFIKTVELNVRSVYDGEPPLSIPAACDFPPAGGATVTAAIAEEDEGRRRAAITPYSGSQEIVPPPLTPSGQAGGVVVSHGKEWREGNVVLPINGIVLPRPWSIRTMAGDVLFSDSDFGGRSPIDYFLLIMPPKQLRAMTSLTSAQLRKHNDRETSQGEIMRFIGVMILATRFEFRSRASLWATSGSKYIPAACMGKTGMSRDRFDKLWSCVRFSSQPDIRPGDMTSERYRWRLVDDFVERFNEYRMSHFTPSERICVDESMSRWYGQGGLWINHGLPQYIAIDRKPENGCELQNAACGRSGIMLRLKLVTTVEDENDCLQMHEEDDARLLLHGTGVLKHLIIPWVRSGRIVCADSYFASVGTAEELLRLGLRFIGVVKTATRRYPMRALSTLELEQRGDSHGLVSYGSDGQPQMLAFTWMDRDRRYFISTASSLTAGTPYRRNRWRQVDATPNADPERVEHIIPQPEAAEIYYDTCGLIDRHNRCRQNDLSLEKKFGTMDWSMRVNMTVLGMIVVDS
jgi:Transposase IS4